MMTSKAAVKQAFLRAGFLTVEEEYRLTRAGQAGDRAAMNRLVSAYEPFARGMAFRHRSQQEVEDRIQVAMTALWESAKRFDPSKGYRLSTYAKARINRDLSDAGEKAASRLKLNRTKNRRKTHQNVLRVCSEMGIDPENRLTDLQARAVADAIGVEPIDVREALETGEAAFCVSVSDLETEDHAPDIAERDEAAKRREALVAAVAELSPMMREIARKVILSPRPAPVMPIIRKHRSNLNAGEAQEQAREWLSENLRRQLKQRGLTP